MVTVEEDISLLRWSKAGLWLGKRPSTKLTQHTQRTNNLLLQNNRMGVLKRWITA
ncbi:hypothetical protein PAMP_006121 [Pampus punctatissimus]